MARGTKKGNYESLKFLAVLAAIFVIILIIYFISRGSEAKNPPIDIGSTPTPTTDVNTPGPTTITDVTPSATSTPVAKATDTPVPTASVDEPSATPTAAVEEPTGTPAATPTNEAAPTPAAKITSTEAKKALETIVDPAVYTATLISGSFSPSGDGEVYYRYSISETATKKQMTPEILVNAVTASVYCYQDGKIFDCVQFPLDETEQGGGNGQTGGNITSQEAVKILLTYGRDQLQLPKDPSKYTSKVDTEPTVTLAEADGIQAYLIQLFEEGEKLVGTYAVSVDGIFVYRLDDMLGMFIKITEG